MYTIPGSDNNAWGTHSRILGPLWQLQNSWPTMAAAEFWAHYGSCRILGPLWQLQNSGPTMAAAEFWAHYGSCRILGPLRQLQNFGPFLLRCLHSIPLWVNLFKHLPNFRLGPGILSLFTLDQGPSVINPSLAIDQGQIFLILSLEIIFKLLTRAQLFFFYL